MEDEKNQKKSEIPVLDTSSITARDLGKLTTPELEKLLSDVLEQEDYIRAIEIRDELKKRNK